MGAIHFKDTILPYENNPGAVVKWILRNVPCFVGRIPMEWTDEVIKSLDKQHVSEYVIAHSIKLARSHGYDFGEIEFLRLGVSVTWQYKAAPLPANYVPQTSIGVAEPMTPDYVRKQAAIYEKKYILAVKTDDYTAQASLLSGFMNFLRSLVATLMIGRKLGEHETRQRAGEQLRLTAGTLSLDADKLERMGIRNPTPDDVRTRIAPARPSGGRPKPRK